MTKSEALLLGMSEIGSDGGEPIFSEEIGGFTFFIVLDKDREYYMTNQKQSVRYYEFAECQALLNNIEKHVYEG